MLRSYLSHSTTSCHATKHHPRSPRSSSAARRRKRRRTSVCSRLARRLQRRTHHHSRYVRTRPPTRAKCSGPSAGVCAHTLPTRNPRSPPRCSAATMCLTIPGHALRPRGGRDRVGGSSFGRIECRFRFLFVSTGFATTSLHVGDATCHIVMQAEQRARSGCGLAGRSAQVRRRSCAPKKCCARRRRLCSEEE